MWDPKANKVVVSRDVIFDEKSIVTVYLGKRETGARKLQWQ